MGEQEPWGTLGEVCAEDGLPVFQGLRHSDTERWQRHGEWGDAKIVQEGPDLWAVWQFMGYDVTTGAPEYHCMYANTPEMAQRFHDHTRKVVAERRANGAVVLRDRVPAGWRSFFEEDAAVL